MFLSVHISSADVVFLLSSIVFILFITCFSLFLFLLIFCFNIFCSAFLILRGHITLIVTLILLCQGSIRRGLHTLILSKHIIIFICCIVSIQSLVRLKSRMQPIRGRVGRGIYIYINIYLYNTCYMVTCVSYSSKGWTEHRVGRITLLLLKWILKQLLTC